MSRLAAWTASSKEGPLRAKLSWPRCLHGLFPLLVTPIGSDFRQKHFLEPDSFEFFNQAQSVLERDTEHPRVGLVSSSQAEFIGFLEVLNLVLWWGEVGAGELPFTESLQCVFF